MNMFKYGKLQPIGWYIGADRNSKQNERIGGKPTQENNGYASQNETQAYSEDVNWEISSRCLRTGNLHFTFWCIFRQKSIFTPDYHFFKYHKKSKPHSLIKGKTDCGTAFNKCFELQEIMWIAGNSPLKRCCFCSFWNCVTQIEYIFCVVIMKRWVNVLQMKKMNEDWFELYAFVVLSWLACFSPPLQVLH